MIAGGGKKIREILIVADSRELIKPCGACLQRIAEFAVLLGVSEELLTDDTVDLILSGDEKLYFNGTSPTETREKADVLLSEVSAMLDDEDFTENDKTTFFSCIAEKYFAGKAKNHKETIDNAV